MIGATAADLTVIIPTRDRWDILALTLQGLRGQTVTGFETVVVVDGEDQRIPDIGATVLTIPKGGPGAARNAGVARAGTRLILFLGDDTIPDPELVERHLDRHRSEPDERIAVLGDISWHPQVGDSRLHHWLDWSATQFDYRRLRRDLPADAGYGRFIASNTSLKRSLFVDAGGFDTDFAYFCEDLDLGYRLAQRGMVLRYEPRARARHLHRYDWPALERRFAAIAPGERRMTAKHPGFRSHFQPLIEDAAVRPPVSPLWATLVDRTPDNGGRVRRALEERANIWYHQRLAPAFRYGWELDEELGELAEYSMSNPAAASVIDGLASTRPSPHGRRFREQLAHILGPGGRVLDFDCGVGSNGIRLLTSGYSVAFAPGDEPSAEYVRWRLARRGLDAPVYRTDQVLPGSFDVAASLGGIQGWSGLWGRLRSLEGQAPTVLVVVDEDGSTAGGDGPGTAAQVLKHARRHGLVRYRRFGPAHLIAYRSQPPGTGRARATGALGSEVALRTGQISSRWTVPARLKRAVLGGRR